MKNLLKFVLKKWKLGCLAAIFGVIVLSLVCVGRKAERKPIVEKRYTGEQLETETNSEYVSNILPEACLLCGDGNGSLLPIYRGQENIGIISLNTCNIVCIRINPYDDNGNLIQEPAKGHSTHITNTGDNGFLAMISEDTDRGLAHGSLSFNRDEILDMENFSDHFCTDCMNRIMEQCWRDNPTGLGVMHFGTGDVRIFEKGVTAFQFGDYYISCEPRERQEDDAGLEMELLIFYCPKRFGD